MKHRRLPPDSRPPWISRRQLLQAGGSGIFGLTLPRLLSAGSTRAPAKSCIFIVLSGAPSHIDTLDPKPDGPTEIRGPYRAIATRTPGVHVSEMLPLLAAQSHRYCLVRSMSHSDAVHVTAAHTMLTGQSDGRRENDSPMIGSLISKLRPSTGHLPSHVWLHNMKTGTNKIPKYHSGLGKIGYAHAPVQLGYELDNPSAPGFRVRAFDPPEGLSSGGLQGRLRLLDSLPRRPLTQSAAAQQYSVFQQRARDLIAGPQAGRAFELRHEPERVRERYGRHPLGQYSLMARRLVESGVRIVTVTGWPGLAPGETTPTVTQVWDTHGQRYADGDSMFGNGPFGMKWSLPRVDQAVSALLEDLADRGMLDETLVVVAGEFGRTPKFELNGKGRDHWPHAYTTLLAGGGVRGGAVYGASDHQGAFVASGRLISHVDFGATLYRALGIPPETRYGPDGFSFRASDGQPLDEIFG